MAAWWNDLIKLWEVPDVTQPPAPRPPGIHYAVKQALDRTRLVEDIGVVLDRGLMENRAPAGLTVGQLSPGSVGLTFSRDERETLYDLGINPIVVKQGIPYVWGQRFQASEGQVHSIVEHGQLTSEFRTWISEPSKAADAMVIHIGKRQPGYRQLAERFKLKRYLHLTDQELIENEAMWVIEQSHTGSYTITDRLKPYQPPRPPADPNFDPEDWGSVTQPVPLPWYTPAGLTKAAAGAPSQPNTAVHPLHRAISARSHPIGLVTLDNR